MARKNNPTTLTFAGGVNALRREADVDLNECTEGQNFDLKSQQLSLSPRRSLEVIAVVPGAKAIRGYAQLLKTDGTISTLIQSGGDVYSWDGTSTGFTLVGTVDQGARLRTSRDSNVTDEDIVIITDLNKISPVKQWDGTTFGNFTHNLSDTLYAKYCKVFKERAHFFNVKSGTDTPHVMLASEGGDPHTLTIVNKPSSAVSAEDPWFLAMPDLRPVNGVEFAYGTVVISTSGGRIYHLIEEPLQVATGTISEKRLDEFYAGSSLAGDEAITQIGNDIMMGLKGRIELLSGVQQFGDVQADDASLPITPLVENFTSWTLAYDRSQQLVYCLPNQSNSIFVYYKSVAFSDVAEINSLSPWSEFTTNASIDMTNSTMMPLVDPVTNVETVFLGSQDGRIYDFSGDRGKDGQEVFPVTFRIAPGGTTTLERRDSMGGVDGKKGTFSFWYNNQSTGGLSTPKLRFASTSAGSSLMNLAVVFSSEVSFFFTNSAGTTLLDSASTVGDVFDSNWHHIVASWDLSVPTFDLYIDDVDAAPTNTTLIDGTLAYSGFDIAIVSLLSSVDAGTAEIYFNREDYIDLSVLANRRKFIGDDLLPVDLGSDGSTPTGSVPWVYLHNEPSTFHVNSGNAGTFSVTGTPIATFATPLGTNGAAIVVKRKTKLFVPVPVDDEMFDIKGWVAYKKSGAFDISLTFLYGGFEEANQTVTLSIPATAAGGFYHGPYYYGDGTPYSSKRKSKTFRQNFGPIAGRGQNLQVEVEVSATTDFEISEIGLQFESSSR